MNKMILPRVSVLLPLYNCEAYVEASLTSLANQTFDDFEVIAVNDGSSDRTGRLADDFVRRDRRFHVIHTENRGIVAALNLATAQARGVYLARMDGDDVARHDRFSEQVVFLDNNPDCVCVGSLCRFIDEQGNIYAEQKPSTSFHQTDLNVFPPYIVAPSHPSIMMRRHDFEALSGYRSAFPHAEDHDLFLRMARRGRIDVIQKPLLDYRIFRGSVSGQNNELQVDSALRSTLSAISELRGGEDLGTVFPSGTLDDYLQTFSDPQFSNLHKIYSIYFMVNVSAYRHQRLASAKKLIILWKHLALMSYQLAAERRFYVLVVKAIRSTARLALKKL